ncbi:hypothetical protein [Paenibacillus sp. J22TS3]|uniref:hypothetical protein n=1 Tax=Paenibacillus sp. J22TS3 TaxID=2807192 RepID=UPI001B110546|nr:hypothetical protein [Paenibacillus sp. J22TS3]GIP22233.1 hypothetical protein J22TS3_25080 [Paenibacillus sp. J22TS3]
MMPPDPDFIVWVDDAIVAIDTKGEHLIVGGLKIELFHLVADSIHTEIYVKLTPRS